MLARTAPPHDAPRDLWGAAYATPQARMWAWFWRRGSPRGLPRGTGWFVAENHTTATMYPCARCPAQLAPGWKHDGCEGQPLRADVERGALALLRQRLERGDVLNASSFCAQCARFSFENLRAESVRAEEGALVVTCAERPAFRVCFAKEQPRTAFPLFLLEPGELAAALAKDQPVIGVENRAPRKCMLEDCVTDAQLAGAPPPPTGLTRAVLAGVREQDGSPARGGAPAAPDAMALARQRKRCLECAAPLKGRVVCAACVDKLAREVLAREVAEGVRKSLGVSVPWAEVRSAAAGADAPPVDARQRAAARGGGVRVRRRAGGQPGHAVGRVRRGVRGGG